MQWAFPHFFAGEDPLFPASTERKIIRWMHIILSIPVIGYIYGPVATIPDAALMVKLVFFPIIVFSGFYLWKGHWLKKWWRSR